MVFCYLHNVKKKNCVTGANFDRNYLSYFWIKFKNSGLLIKGSSVCAPESRKWTKNRVDPIFWDTLYIYDKIFWYIIYIFSAILVLTQRIDFDQLKNPICMPHWALRPYKNYEATIAGWGKFGKTWVSNLKETSVLIWSQEFCNGTMEREWKNTNKWHTVTKYCCSLFWEKRLTLKVFFLDQTCALGQFTRHTSSKALQMVSSRPGEIPP